VPLVQPTMPSRFTRILLFLSSYFPLFLIFAIQNYKLYYTASLLLALIGLISILCLLWQFRTVQEFGPVTLRVDRVNSRDSDLMSYIVTYIVPFMAIRFDSFETLLSLVILFFMIAVIYVNSNMIFVNPMLSLFGYHIFEIESDGCSHSLITKKNHLARNSSFKVVKMGGELLMEATA
jgi:hypothetical protein